ncbi:putative brevis radix (BRX) domain, transcription factor BREVIS RADIX domain-containing protein [Helianthus annuus]|nr:putative brevis radix (BRX) domain, transcription factor BREVIS RADIX domain-containing protein [Helianthus annuus]
MLTCVTRSKQQPDEQDGGSNRYGDTPAGKQSMKTLTSQIKDMALKASGAYRSCTPCAGPTMMMTPEQQLQRTESESSERLRRSYRRTGSKNSSSGRVWGKEMEARLKGISMGSGFEPALSASGSGRRYEPIVLIEEIEPKEWVAQVEPGVLITFISLPTGGNDLKRIRFSREMFNKWQAQRWWQENFDKVMELYNVRRLNRQAFPLPIPPKSEDEQPLNSRSANIESIEDNPLVPTLSKERLPHTMDLDHPGSTLARSNNDSFGLTVTPKVSSISATKTMTSSLDAASNSSREVDHSGELSISKVSDVDNEWVEQVEPGVYITIRVLPGGSRELRRVRFSREKFGEVHARLWWEENRARIQKQYL